MAEHTLGKGEVESSILSHSTILIYFQYAFGLKFAAPEVKNSDMLEAWSNGLLRSRPHRVAQPQAGTVLAALFRRGKLQYAIMRPFDGLAISEDASGALSALYGRCPLGTHVDARFSLSEATENEPSGRACEPDPQPL